MIDQTLSGDEVCQMFHDVVLAGVTGDFWRKGVFVVDKDLELQIVAYDPETSLKLVSGDLTGRLREGLIFTRGERDVMAHYELEGDIKPSVVISMHCQGDGPVEEREVERIFGYRLDQVSFARYETLFGDQISVLHRGGDEYQMMLRNKNDGIYDEVLMEVWRSLVGR